MSGVGRRALLAMSVVLACFVAMSAVAPQPASGASGRGAMSARRAAALRKNENILFSLINKARTKRGLKSLRLQNDLRKAARLHSRQMLVHDFFSHYSPSGRSYGARIARCGYGRSGYAAWKVGEVIAWGDGIYGVPQLVLRRWMDSSPHRAVILGRSWREMGVGLVKGKFCGLSGVYLYTVDFGRRSG